MPFYAGNTRVNLNSASSLYQPADSSGAACNLGQISGGTATPFYANGTQIYIKPSGSWHTIWTGSQALKYGADTTEGSNIGYTTISGLSVSITSSMKFKVYVTTTYGNSGWVDEDNEPKAFSESRRIGTKTSYCDSSVFAPDYKTSSSVQITAKLIEVSPRPMYPSIKATEIQAYY